MSRLSIRRIGGVFFATLLIASLILSGLPNKALAATTSLVSDTASQVGPPTIVNGTIYFYNPDGLWKSDGTSAGTELVKSLSSVSGLTDVDGILFFTANDGVHGQELWKSDGTTTGTVMVKDIWPGSTSSNIGGFTNVNGTLFFSARDRNDGLLPNQELWKSDGTIEGTVIVKEIVAPGGSSPGIMASVNGILFFTARDGFHGHELWKSDGTEAGTVMVKDINPGSGSSYPTSYGHVEINGTLYFAADDGVHGFELWKSDGTSIGTTIVKDIKPGSASSKSQLYLQINGVLFFTAEQDLGTQELWKSDGTETGTVMIKDIKPGSSSGEGPTGPPYAGIRTANVSGTYFFTTSDGISGTELWKSDGTAGGTGLVSDIRPGTSGSFPNDFESTNGVLYFVADDGSGSRLWKTVVDTTPPIVSSSLTPSANSNGWHNSDVTIDWQATDPSPSSGTPTNPPDTIASTEGANVNYTSDPSCDPAGNCATGSVTLSIDKTLPTVSNLALSTNPKAISETSQLSFSASDGLSGVQEVEYFIGDDPGQGNGADMTFNGSVASVTIGTDMPVGVYPYSVRAQDNAGNWSDPVTVYLTVYDPSGGFVTATRMFTPSLANGDILPGLTSSGQTEQVQFGATVKYQNGGLQGNNNDFMFSYYVGNGCQNPNSNCTGISLDSTSIDWLILSENDTVGTFQGTADVTVDGTTTSNPYRVEVRSSDHTTNPKSIVIEVFAPGDDPNTDPPLYRASGTVTGNISVEQI